MQFVSVMSNTSAIGSGIVFLPKIHDLKLDIAGCWLYMCFYSVLLYKCQSKVFNILNAVESSMLIITHIDRRHTYAFSKCSVFLSGNFTIMYL